MKGSGWARYRQFNYLPDNTKFADRRRDRVDPRTIQDAQQLKMFVDQPVGPVSYALKQSSYIEESDDGTVKIRADRVKEAAKEYVAEARTNQDTVQLDQDADPKERIRQVQDAYWFDDVSERQAINLINRQEAAHAEALLTAARVGKVKLTDVQSRRLEAIANGQYFNLVQERYKDAEQRRDSAAYTKYGRLGKYDKDNRSAAQKADDAAAWDDRMLSYSTLMSRESLNSYHAYR